MPSDDDTVFCGGLEYSIDGEGNNLKNLSIFIATPRLIKLTRFKSSHVVTDGAYKLNYNGFPILMIGTTDFSQKYLPYGVMLTKKEDAGDYDYMFKTLKDLALSVENVSFEPYILLVDCVTKEFRSVYKREIC